MLSGGHIKTIAVRVPILWISGEYRYLFCLDALSIYLRCQPFHSQSHLRPEELWHQIPFEICRHHQCQLPSLLIFLFYILMAPLPLWAEKCFLTHVLYFLLLWGLNSIITPLSICSVSFKSSPEEGLICLGSAEGLKVKLRS